MNYHHMPSEIIKPDRNNPVSKKNAKSWKRPVVMVLTISRDTFSGSVTGVEIAGKSGPPAKQ